MRILKQIKLLLILSISLFILANALFYIFVAGFTRIRTLEEPLLEYYAISSYPAFEQRLAMMLGASAFLFLLALAAYIMQLILRKKARSKFSDSVATLVGILFLCFPLIAGYIGGLRYAVYAFSKNAGAVHMQTDTGKWQVIRSRAGNFSIKIPQELSKKERDHKLTGGVKESVVFVPGEFSRSLVKYEPFEFWVTTVELKPDTSLEQFREVQDEGLKKYSRSFHIFNTMSVAVGDGEGIRDEIMIKAGAGWQRYSRIMLSFQGKVIILKCVIGRKSEVYHYRDIFDTIVRTFKKEGV